MKKTKKIIIASLLIGSTMISPSLWANPPIEKVTEVIADLEVKPLYTNEELKQLLAKLNQLQTIEMKQHHQVTIRVPDYKPAYYALQLSIVASLKNYYQALDHIYNKMTLELSKIAKVKEQMELESNANGVMHKLYAKILVEKLPQLNTEINAEYQRAVKGLYTANNALVIPLYDWTSNKGYYTQLKEYQNTPFENSIMGICQTYVCALKIKEDILVWQEFVSQMNREIDFSKIPNILVTQFEVKKNSPLISIAMLQASKEMIGISMKLNTQYKTASLIGEYMTDTLRSGAGIAGATLAIPTFVLEHSMRSIGDALQNISNKKYMKTGLLIKKIKAYEYSDIENSFSPIAEEWAESKKDMAVFEDEFENKEYQDLLLRSLNRGGQLTQSQLIQFLLIAEPSLKKFIKSNATELFEQALLNFNTENVPAEFKEERLALIKKKEEQQRRLLRQTQSPNQSENSPSMRRHGFYSFDYASDTVYQIKRTLELIDQLETITTPDEYQTLLLPVKKAALIAFAKTQAQPEYSPQVGQCLSNLLETIEAMRPFLNQSHGRSVASATIEELLEITETLKKGLKS